MDFQSIIKRAWEDEAFKRALLSDPRRVLEDHLGVLFPEGAMIFIHEQTPTQVHLILPMPPEIDDDQATD